MAPQNDKPPTSTTNVILGVTLSFGIVALVLGLYLIYKAYMKYLKYQQNNNLHPHGRSPNRTSAQKAVDETLLRDKYPEPGQRMPSQNSLRHWKQRPIDMRETGRDYTNGNATNRPKETSDSSRGRRFDGGQRAESLHGKRVRGRPPVPRPQRAYQERPQYVVFKTTTGGHSFGTKLTHCTAAVPDQLVRLHFRAGLIHQQGFKVKDSTQTKDLANSMHSEILTQRSYPVRMLSVSGVAVRSLVPCRHVPLLTAN